MSGSCPHQTTAPERGCFSGHTSLAQVTAINKKMLEVCFFAHPNIQYGFNQKS